jgi:acetyl esterase/lipase
MASCALFCTAWFAVLAALLWAGFELAEPSLPVNVMGLMSTLSASRVRAAVAMVDVKNPHKADPDVIEAMKANLYGVGFRRFVLQEIGGIVSTALGVTNGPRCYHRAFKSTVQGGPPGSQLRSPVLVVDPPSGRAASNGNVLLYYHGGGFAVGEPEMNIGFYCHISAATNVTVVSVDYRLSPEHAFPAAFDDSLAAALDIVTKGVPTEDGSAPTPVRRLILGGDSAGGNLATGVSVAAATSSVPASSEFDAFDASLLTEQGSSASAMAALRAKLRGTLLIYPLTQVPDPRTGSMRDLSDGHLLTRDAVENFKIMYLRSRAAASVLGRGTPRDEALRRDWRIYPGTHLKSDAGKSDAEALVPTIVVVPQYDVLRDDGISLHKRLADASGQPGKHEFVDVPRATHGFLTTPEYFPVGWMRMVDALEAFTAKALNIKMQGVSSANPSDDEL